MWAQEEPATDESEHVIELSDSTESGGSEEGYQADSVSRTVRWKEAVQMSWAVHILH